MTLSFYQSDLFWAINIPLAFIAVFMLSQFYYDWKERKARKKVKRPVIVEMLLSLDDDQKLN